MFVDSLFGAILFGLICSGGIWQFGLEVALDWRIVWCLMFGAYGLGWIMRDDHA